MRLDLIDLMRRKVPAALAGLQRTPARTGDGGDDEERP
jgi:hypothetical protein